MHTLMIRTLQALVILTRGVMLRQTSVVLLITVPSVLHVAPATPITKHHNVWTPAKVLCLPLTAIVGMPNQEY